VTARAVPLRKLEAHDWQYDMARGASD